MIVNSWQEFHVRKSGVLAENIDVDIQTYIASKCIRNIRLHIESLTFVGISLPVNADTFKAIEHIFELNIQGSVYGEFFGFVVSEANHSIERVGFLLLHKKKNLRGIFCK
ncbi:hypothetical protein D3C86_1435810 [compost metagenome]